jgi:hypothetical protein
MNELKAYIELYSGRQWPQLEFCFNNQSISPKNKHIVYSSNEQQNIIFEFEVKLQDYNCFEVCMNNKSDEELFSSDVGFGKHYIKFQEIEVDQIKFEKNCIKNCQSMHGMSDEWVKTKKQFGLDLDRIYYNNNELRLNGCCSVRFKQPIWEWYSQPQQNL